MEIKYRLAFHLRRSGEVDAKVAIAGTRSVVKLICDWNDHISTTHTDILEALHTLGI